MKPESGARLAVSLLALGLPLALVGGWRAARSSSVVTMHARMSEDGGWSTETLRVAAGEPLQLNLISDDVVHGFAIGHSDLTPIDLQPGQMVRTTLVFPQPGTYTFYCTRWCGPNHWRMRGEIEVTGPAVSADAPQPPLYQTLGIDLDAPHPAAVVPARRPSAARGADLGIDLPATLADLSSSLARSPAEAWLELRADPSTDGLSGDDVWDLVAWVWRSYATDASIEAGAALFAQNCAACHGESGAGDGVMAGSIDVASMGSGGTSAPLAPADFTDAARMLGASPALLQGKITRGGMGTGMPYWGPVLTEAQIWSLTDYLWTFQFEESR
ncbi:MAG TPA: c-type cytochrome [Anaerolineales bacterium]|nr:c-type cytochrome [Anaerolineales bacterium]